MTTIQLDGRPHDVPDVCTLAALVDALGLAPNSIATAVDGAFVPRSQRDEITLREGASVLLFQPIVGG